MSRTRKTAPFRVKLARGDLHAIPVHDHSLGDPCDLPPRESLKAETQYMANTSCHWSFSYTGTNVCCCPLCRDGAEEFSRRKNDKGPKVSDWD